jgi:threonylcarbamoyladenosine tRNA methylthiotransferase MtaB
VSGVEVINFGCRLNIAEGEAIRKAAGGADNLIVINSCAVTNEAERQVRQTIRRTARSRPDARIVVTGCAADINPQAFAAMPEVAALIPNTAKGLASAYAPNWMPGGKPEFVPAVSGADHVRAFVEVQNGCDHRCTFCIIPFGRGDSRSAPAGGVIEAVRGAVERGHQEIVLTGVDLTSYGPDLPGAPSLGRLVERILKHVPDVKRLRLSSLDSVEIDDLLLDLLTGDPRMMPHVHLSLQAGDNMILKRMKRRHAREDAIRLVERMKAKRPEIAVGADIIAGFPTETDDMFENSLALIDDCDIVFGHIFPFSSRAGTPAARMPQVDRSVAKERAARLRARADSRKAAWLQSLVGSQQSVLLEKDGRGHAASFADVHVSGAARRGDLLSVRVTGSDGATLLADPL